MAAASFWSVPHPLLKEPILYVADVPNGIKWKQLSKILSPCGPVGSGGRNLVPGTDRRRWKVIFSDMFKAEMALATLSGTQVTGPVAPPWTLCLSHSSELDATLPEAPLLPLFIRTYSNGHPLQSTDAQTIFKWFRRAGPLLAVRVNVDVGLESPVCVLEYWKEEYIQYARRVGRAIHFDTQNMAPFTLHVYDPWNLYCSSLGAQMRNQDFREEFGKFDGVIESYMVRSGISNAYGFVSFKTREEATRAMREMNGKNLGGRNIVVRYHEPKSLVKLHPHPRACITAIVRDPPKQPDTAPQQNKEEREQADRTREEEAQREEAQKAEDEAKQQRIYRAKVEREVAEAIEHKAAEVKDQALVDEADKTEEVQWAEETEKQAEETFRKARQAFEDAARVLDECRTRLTLASQQAEKATISSLHAQTQLRAATAAREAAEADESRAREAREKAEQEEREALGKDTRPEAQDDEQDDEVRKREELAESIRKLAELRIQEEADKRERELQEARSKMAEFEVQERQRKRAQREAEAAQIREKAERERLAREEAERKVRELREKEERAKAEALERKRVYFMGAAQERARCRTRDEAKWKRFLPWTVAKSLDRFRLISTEFDDIKFCATKPLIFESVPWPVRHSPYELTVDHIEWGEVEAFFAAIEKMVSASEYKTLVTETHRRFHPDKWRSRGLLNTVVDYDANKRLEEAGNIVAQALTPIWLKSRSNA